MYAPTEVSPPMPRMAGGCPLDAGDHAFLLGLQRLALGYFLDNQTHRRGGRHRPHLNVIIDHNDYLAGLPGRVPGGGHLDGATISRLLCDCAVHRVVTKGRSSILDYGTATRTVPANLWAALVVRDEHCTFGDCDRGPEWCDAHHVVPVEHYGPTNLFNCRLGCRRHHHMVHEGGWTLTLDPDRKITLTRPDGTVDFKGDSTNRREARAGPAH